MRHLTSLFLFVVLLATLPATAEAGRRIHLDELRQAGVLPPIPAQPRLATPVRVKAAPEVGEQRSFWTYDLSVMPPKNVQIAATCRGVGETVAVYVDDDEWEFLVDDEGVANIIASFDEATPAGEPGITARNTAMFGPASDIDGNERLIVFLYRIPSYHGNSFDGFFRVEDLLDNDPACESNPSLYCSNEAEMIHVQVIGGATDYMAGVMAHEFQHLIHFLQDPNEESWINEAMSELAMSSAGYEDDGNVGAYASDHEVALETTGFVSYGAVMLWGTYLYERFGADFVRSLVAQTSHGRASVEAALAAADEGLDYPTLFADWAAATAFSLMADGEDFALVAVPDKGADEEIEVPTDADWGGLAAIVAPSAFRSFLVSTERPDGAVLDAWFEGNDDVQVRVLPYGAQTLVVAANPALTTATGSLQALWVDDAPVVEEPTTGDVVESPAEDVVSFTDLGSEPDAGATEADAREGADVVASEDVGAAFTGDGGGGGDCTAGGASSVPSVLVLLLVGLAVLRRAIV